MNRIEISLTERQFTVLCNRAQELGVDPDSVARAILVERLKCLEALASLSGIGEGPPDLGLNHDQYLYGTE